MVPVETGAYILTCDHTTRRTPVVRLYDHQSQGQVRVRVLLTYCPCAHSPYIHSLNMQTPCRKRVHLDTLSVSVNNVNDVQQNNVGLQPCYRLPKPNKRLFVCLADAKSCVDVGDRLRDCRTENIHTRNTLVIDFRLAMVRQGYGIPYFSMLSTVTTNPWRYLCVSLL